jgi:hypothetical protein
MNTTREREEFFCYGNGAAFWFFSFDLYPMNPQAGNVDWTPSPLHPLHVIHAIVVITQVVESSGDLQTPKKNLLGKKNKRHQLPKH